LPHRINSEQPALDAPGAILRGRAMGLAALLSLGLSLLWLTRRAATDAETFAAEATRSELPTPPSIDLPGGLDRRALDIHEERPKAKRPTPSGKGPPPGGKGPPPGGKGPRPAGKGAPP
jgi:hypothetical protein